MKFVSLYLLGMFIPHVYLMYLNWIVFEMIVPITGRTGSEIPPDMLMAAITVLVSIFLSSYFVRVHFFYQIIYNLQIKMVQ